MKALSIQQPWAWMILYGTKRVENRTWSTKFRGDFLIHAGLKVDREAMADLESDILAVPEPRPKAHRGGLLGIASVIDCVRVEQIASNEWANGPWCFVLSDIRPFEKPIPWKGELGFFNVPESALAESTT